MNFNEVLIKDSQLTRRWGNGKVFKGNVSGGHALCSALCKPGTERYKSAGPPIFLLCMCYYDFCNKVSANSVVRNECPAVSDDPFCCWGTVLLLMCLAKCTKMIPATD